MKGIEQAQHKRSLKRKSEAQNEIMNLTDANVSLRNSKEITKHPNFVSWFRVNISSKIPEYEELLRNSDNTVDLHRAQGALKFADSVKEWEKNITHKIDKNNNRIEVLKKDLNND
jgi:hypothetical protein